MKSMKSVVIFAALVCTILQSCPADSHPSAHIESLNYGDVVYGSNKVIKDWSTSAPYSHLTGGMTYNDGKLSVPTTGRYYIYAQMYYRSYGRVFVRVNDNDITMMHAPQLTGSTEGALYTGGVFNLNAGDEIMLVTYWHSIRIYMQTIHTYFGAYQLV